jgi:NhaP-type Na+/H+ or K+/H+ antiporter
VPDVIVLLITGIALGPVLHWVDGSKFSEVTRGFGTLALILILFAAGLELDLRTALKQFGAGTVLALLIYSLSFVGVSYFCVYALHLALMPSLLVGATLACMSGSVILPVLEQLEMRDSVKTTLVIEASFGDGLGALGVGVLIDLALGGAEIKSGPLPNLLARAGLAPGSHGQSQAQSLQFYCLNSCWRSPSLSSPAIFGCGCCQSFLTSNSGRCSPSPLCFCFTLLLTQWAAPLSLR